MKAIVQTRYGTAADLELREIDRPAPAADEVLVRVRAASLHADVWHVVTGRPFVLRLFGAGLRRPKNPVPGTDIAGVVESVGKAVSRFRPGDAVFGETIRGMQWINGGAFAEFATAPEAALVLKPASVSFEQAAAVPTSALIALMNLRDFGRIRAGQRVLINGAGGGVGCIAVQVAKAFGTEVTAVDCTGKLDLLRALGADHVVDFTREDFTRSAARYDLILDIPGNHSFAECRRALTPEGIWVLVAHDQYGRGGHRWLGALPRMFLLMARTPFTRQLPRATFKTPDRPAALALLQQLLESGKLTPHIDQTFPLAEVPAALRYLQTGRVKGKVVITIN